MKLSKLIGKLQALKKEVGDVEVFSSTSIDAKNLGIVLPEGVEALLITKKIEEK